MVFVSEYDDDQGDNVTFVVKRGEVFMSAYKQLQNRRPSSLRRSFDVTFSGEPGTYVCQYKPHIVISV